MPRRRFLEISALGGIAATTSSCLDRRQKSEVDGIRATKKLLMRIREQVTPLYA
ncbi:MAG: hypothetical protein HXY20_05985 [Acidobacteria bacterium]|nr:hypothetical protein [Acidobacteriota bacterium]